MNERKYSSLENFSNIICPSDLKNQKDRTLVYGYDLERNTFHLYLKDNLFHRIIYNDKISDKIPTTIIDEDYNLENIELHGCIPSKRVYPECSDSDFCKILISRGICVPFTKFTERKENKIFYGYIGS
ncbi:MAG TPA: hypothetical protein VMZ91_08080 [Candidatus Paceibacterota bacterium]|nr:hypothetical protein [Candidatus Paceibacterota bacterium]